MLVHLPCTLYLFLVLKTYHQVNQILKFGLFELQILYTQNQ